MFFIDRAVVITQQILRSTRGLARCVRIRPEKSIQKKLGCHALLRAIGNAHCAIRALRLHPDKGGDPELFKEVTHAYVSEAVSYALSANSRTAVMKSSPIHKSGVSTMRGVKLV